MVAKQDVSLLDTLTLSVVSERPQAVVTSNVVTNQSPKSDLLNGNTAPTSDALTVPLRIFQSMLTELENQGVVVQAWYDEVEAATTLRLIDVFFCESCGNLSRGKACGVCVTTEGGNP
jgi:hypothetical protein